MRFSHTASVLALASTAAADVVRIPVTRNSRSSPGAIGRRHQALGKRATVMESLINAPYHAGYFATVSVGTPPQDVELILDTGSSDAWVVDPTAELCTEVRLQQLAGQTCGKTFNASASSTYNLTIDDGFRIKYADGSYAAGDYFTDEFTIGDITVTALQMGLADNTVIGNGILGIGFELNEATNTKYSNLVTSLMNQGKINTMAFSLYLNDDSSSTGNILFGGVDTEKFIGDLVTVPILPDAQMGVFSSFTVGLSGLSLTLGNGTSLNQSLTTEGGSVKALLDSGTTLSYLPDAFVQPIFDAVGAYIDDSSAVLSGIALVDCALDADFHFTFNNNVTITVPKDEFLFGKVSDGAVLPNIPFSDPCIFGLQSTGMVSNRDYAFLGATFLRSAYVVHDLSNLRMGLAQANLNSTTSSVHELTAGESSLDFTGVASQGAVTSDTSSSMSTTTSSTSTETSPASAQSTGTATGKSTGTATGKSTGTATGTDAGTLSVSSSSIRASLGPPSTSVDASASYVALPTGDSNLGTTSSSGGGALASGNAGSSVVMTGVVSTASAASSPANGTPVCGFPNATILTTTTIRSGSAGVIPTASVSHTNFSAASSSSTGASAAMGQGPPELGSLLGVVSVSLAFTMSGSLLCWL